MVAVVGVLTIGRAVTMARACDEEPSGNMGGKDTC